jgi:hypothetical protein
VVFVFRCGMKFAYRLRLLVLFSFCPFVSVSVLSFRSCFVFVFWFCVCVCVCVLVFVFVLSSRSCFRFVLLSVFVFLFLFCPPSVALVCALVLAFADFVCPLQISCRSCPRPFAVLRPPSAFGPRAALPFLCTSACDGSQRKAIRVKSRKTRRRYTYFGPT